MKNPVNSLLLLTLLFWVPQLLTFRSELKDNNDLHRLFMSMDPATTPPKASAKNIVAGKTASLDSQDTCFINRIRIYEGNEATPSKLILERVRVAEKFSLTGPNASPVAIFSDRVRILNPVPTEGLSWKTSRNAELPAQFFRKSDLVSEALESRIRSTKPLLLEEHCTPFQQEAVVSGFLTDKMEMNYTVSVPFTLFIGDVEAARAQVGAHVSRTYVVTALLSMLISFVGLLFFLNIMLRNRINLEMQPVPQAVPGHPRTLENLRHSPEAMKNQASDLVQKLLPQAKDFTFAQFGNLPSFYRYNWDDGIDLYGRKAVLAVTGSGIVLIETDSTSIPKGMREIPWNDLFCVFFTNWGKQDTWVDIITREGERYQIAFKDIANLRALLKRWDASEINLRKMAS